MAERRVLCARVYYNKKIMFFPRGNTEKAKVSREERRETFGPREQSRPFLEQNNP